MKYWAMDKHYAVLGSRELRVKKVQASASGGVRVSDSSLT